MKKLFVNYFLLPAFIFTSFLSAKATHIVGGDVTVQSLGSNNFQVTLTLFFDCINGSPAAFDPSINLGVYDKVTNVMQQSPVLPFTDSVTLVLGDSCFTPTTLCVRRQRYISTINIPNNPNGYYISWHRCCRNSIITNISLPGSSGNVFYAEIPDPALLNSSPVFATYPDAYMCVGFPNADNFSATDADGDSLVYSLVDPYDCAANLICSSTNPLPLPPSPGPYGIVPWLAPYSGTNAMGDPGQVISNPSGILFTNPPALGVFVICVKVEEFRNAIKIGEIRRDVQYAVLNCNIPNVTVNGPNPICLGQSTTLIATGGTSYSWSTGATTTSIVLSPTSTGSYNYSVSTSNGSCTAIDSINILVAPGETVTASTADDTLCAGGSTTLTANSTSGSYNWSPSAGLSCTNCASPVATPPSTTTYTVISSNGFGCADTAFVSIVIVGTTTAITGNTPLCVGQSSTLTALPSSNYSWSTGATSSSITVTPTSAGSYTYTLTAGTAPCIATASFVLTINPSATANAFAADDTICVGSGTTLTATGGGTYAWSPSSSLNNPTTATPVATPAATTTYTVIVTNTFGCTGSATVTVVPVPPPSVVMGAAQTLCVGESVQLTSTASPGVTYSWVPGTGLSCTSCPNPVANPGFSNTYTLYVSTGNGCSASGTVSVTVGAIPFVSAIASTTICTGDSATLNANASNGLSPYTWYWSPPNALNSATLQNPTAGPGTTTNYTVIVTDANGCTDDTTTTVYLQSIPSVSFAQWTPELTCEGYSVPFKANVSSNGQWVFWDFGDGTSTTTYAPNTDAGTHLYPFNGTYNVVVVVYNPPCKDTVDTTIIVSDMSGFVEALPANVFTPNADNSNDCFNPAFLVKNIPGNTTAAALVDILSQCVYTEVYDRWGIKMFASTDTEKCWDGKTMKGNPANEGTYYYISKFGEITLRGYVTLLRKKN